MNDKSNLGRMAQHFEQLDHDERPEAVIVWLAFAFFALCGIAGWVLRLWVA